MSSTTANRAPLVTVVACVYNAGEYLREAIQSVLTQTYQNLELIVVDDGSTDRCVDLISDISDERLRVIRQSNKGYPTALNRALSEARGEFYAIQDADDISHSKRIERQMLCLVQKPHLAGVFCGYDLILNGRRLAPQMREKDEVACKQYVEMFRMPSHDPTAMYRMSLVGDLRYEPLLRLGAGYDFVLRLGERYPFVVLGECLYSYRIHGSSITASNPERRIRLTNEVLRRACQRRGILLEDYFDLEKAWRKVGKNARRDNNLAAHFIESALDLRQAGRWWEALQTGYWCARLHPSDLQYYKALIYAVAPMWGIRRLRRDSPGDSARRTLSSG